MKIYIIISYVLLTITACSCTFPGVFPGYPGIPLNHLETFNSPFFAAKFDQNEGVLHPGAISNAVSSYDFPQASVSIPLLPSSFPIALYLNRVVDISGPNSFESSAPKIFQFNANPFLYGGNLGTTTIGKLEQSEENTLVEIIKVDGLIPVLTTKGSNDEGDKDDGDGGSGDDSDDGSCKGDCLGDKDPKDEFETPEEESTEKDVVDVEKPEDSEKEDGAESKDESLDVSSGDAEEPKSESSPSINIEKVETLQ